MQPTTVQLEALRGLFDTGIDRGAGVLNTLSPTSLKLEIPSFHFLDQSQLPHELRISGDRVCEVLMPFNGTLEGEARAYFSLEVASKLVGYFTGKKGGSIPIDTLEAGTLSEIANIVLNGVMGKISQDLELNLIYQVPSVREGDRYMVNPSCNRRPFAVIQAGIKFLTDDWATEGDLVLYIEERSFQEMTKRIDHRNLEAV